MSYYHTFESGPATEPGTGAATGSGSEPGSGSGIAIAIAGDHNGVGLKAAIGQWLSASGHTVADLGVHDPAVTVDYPPICVELCREVSSSRAVYGIFVGGTGQGEVIACNKIRGIRAGGCHNLLTAEISRGHNDANVLVLGSKLLDAPEAVAIVDRWLSTPFKGGSHAARLEMIEAIESGAM